MEGCLIISVVIAFFPETGGLVFLQVGDQFPSGGMAAFYQVAALVGRLGELVYLQEGDRVVVEVFSVACLRSVRTVRVSFAFIGEELIGEVVISCFVLTGIEFGLEGDVSAVDCFEAICVV